MQSKFMSAINQICEEKSIPKEIVMETVEAALAAAYKKDFGERDQEVRVKINEETGEIKAYVSKEVVEEIENEFFQINLADAKKIKKNAKLGDVVEIEDTPTDFGRIAAQTAKQVIIQRIREAERDIVFAEYKDKEGDLINASVQRIEGNTVIVDLGHASGVLFSNEQVNGERYYIGQRLKVYIVKVEQSNKGPQVVVSRSHPGVVRKLFETEVPEIESEIVVIKSIAREAGYRTKIAVTSNDENVDPVGSCLGQKGIRVQSVISELGEEKIDVIPWSEDQKEFIKNALSPAKVAEVRLSEADKKALVKVPEDQLSLAIGKNGQNVRLAAKLTGWNIDIGVKEDAGVEAVAGEIEKVSEKETEELVGNPGNEDVKVEGEESLKPDNVETTKEEDIQSDIVDKGAEENIIKEVENPEQIIPEISDNTLENVPIDSSETEPEKTEETLEAEKPDEEIQQVDTTNNSQAETESDTDNTEEPEISTTDNTEALNQDVEEQKVEQNKIDDKLGQDILDENDENNA